MTFSKDEIYLLLLPFEYTNAMQKQRSPFDIIAFDADDTLWHNETRYSQAKEDFAHLLTRYQDTSTASQLLDEIEVRNIALYGYGMKSFTLSMMETAIELSNGQIRGAEMRQILEIARRVLTAEVELFPGVAETIHDLASRFDLMLITKGDASEQESKVQRSGLKDYFRMVEIVHDKDVTTYQRILAKYQLDPRRFVMVGNSLRSDILPVVKLGGVPVYIPQETTWFHEQVDDPHLHASHYYQLEQISQLPSLLERLSQP